MHPAILPLINLAGGFIDKYVKDKDAAENIKSQIAMEAMKSDSEELRAATDVILAEASGESWLQRNWRPILMLWFAGLVGAHWLGFTPQNLGEETILALLDIVKVGIGGYVIGRSVEKATKAYKGGK